MPRGPRGEKRPRDPNQLAKLIVDIATGQVESLLATSFALTKEAQPKVLAGIGAIVLTFLAGAELDPQVFRLKWKEAAAVGFASFSFPFLGCAAAAHYLLGWELMPSWLAGVANEERMKSILDAPAAQRGPLAGLGQLSLWFTAANGFRRLRKKHPEIAELLRENCGLLWRFN
jgi:hypothetical protein